MSNYSNKVLQFPGSTCRGAARPEGNHSTSGKNALAGAIAMSLLVGGAVTNAQQLEEVIVTATKRAGSVQEIPAAIDVYSGSQLSDAGISNLGDLTAINSGFRMNESTGNANIYIRGIGASIAGNTTDQTTAVFIDGAFQSRGYALGALVTELSDITSLQVLKGPQGTLYGRNATSGAVVIETYTPDAGDEFDGRVRATIGDFGVRKVSGRISGGMGDTFAGSLAYSNVERDGFMEIIGPQADGFHIDDGDAFQLKLRWRPSDTADLVFTATYTDEVKGDQPLQQIGHTDSELAAPGLNNAQTAWFGVASQILPVLGINLNPADPGSQFATVYGMAAGLQFTTGADAGFYVNGNNSWQNGLYPIDPDQAGFVEPPNATDLEYTTATLKATFNLDLFDLISITSYNEALTNSTAPDLMQAIPASLPDLTTLAPFDCATATDPGQLAYCGALGLFSTGNIGFSGFANSEAIIQEVYAVSTNSDIEWIVGALYFYEEFTSGNSGDVFGTSAVLAYNDFEVESVSAYGEATFPFGDSLSLKAGLRYSDDENSLNDRINELNPIIVQPGVVDVGSIGVEDEQWTYNLKLTYEAEDLLVYGGITTGYKAGLINSGSPRTGAADPEEITAYELGFKSQLVDGAFKLNGAAFFYDYDNLQLNVLDVASGSTVVVNGAVAEITGLELDAMWLVSDRTTLFVNTTLLDHEFTENSVLNGIEQPITGNQLPHTADVALVAGAQHSIPTGMGEFGLNLSVSHNSGYWVNQTNTVGSSRDGDEDDSFTTANASITFLSNNEAWRITAYVNNLTDEEYFAGGLDAFGGLIQIAARGFPRHYGATVEYNF